MTYPPYLRDRALKMRTEEKLSVVEIAERLAIAKSTVYAWVGHIPLGRPRRENGHPGNAAMCRKYRLIRERAYAKGRDEFEELCELPGFRDFVALYIAEGYKRNRNCISIANSDPAVMVFSVAWIRRFSDRPLDCSLQYHADQSTARLRRFWARHLDVEPETIRLQRKSNSGQLAGRRWRSAHGVIAARVNDTALRARLQGWIDCLREQWEFEARLAAVGA